MIRGAGLPLPDPAARRHPSDPCQPVRRADGGPLRASGGSSASRSSSRRRRCPSSSSRGTPTRASTSCSAAGSPTTTIRTISRSRSSTPGNGAARAYFSSPGDRPPPRGGAGRGAAGRPRGALPEVRARPARPRDPRAALPRRGLPDRRPPGPRPPAAEHGALRQLRRARKGRGGRRIGPAERPAGGGILHVPIAGVVRSIDPARLRDRWSTARSSPSLFETLTRALEGTRIVPWLASEVLTENDGRRYRFRLRPGVRFHDGRRLTARDVRFSWERLLASGEREPLAAVAHPRSPADHRRRGDRPRGLSHRLADGVLHRPREARRLLPGRHFLRADRDPPGGDRRGRRDCARRAPSGPAPSGSSASSPAGGSSSSATRPTGGRAIPRSDGIVFRFGVSPEEIRSEFLAGRFSLAFDLLPADAEAFRHDPRFASRYRENPRLTTYYVDVQRPRRPAQGRGAAPPPRARRRRRRVRPPRRSGGSRSPPTASSRRACSATRRPSPASGPVSGTSGPSGQLGRGDGLARDDRADGRRPPRLLRRVLGLLPRAHRRPFARSGSASSRSTRRWPSTSSCSATGEGDLNIGRWNADYPDADNFVHTLLHSDSGFLGKFVGNAGDRRARRARAGRDRSARPPLDLPPRRGADRPRGAPAPALPRPDLLLRAAGGRGPRLRQPGQSDRRLRKPVDPAVDAGRRRPSPRI